MRKFGRYAIQATGLVLGLYATDALAQAVPAVPKAGTPAPPPTLKYQLERDDIHRVVGVGTDLSDYDPTGKLVGTGTVILRLEQVDDNEVLNPPAATSTPAPTGPVAPGSPALGTPLSAPAAASVRRVDVYLKVDGLKDADEVQRLLLDSEDAYLMIDSRKLAKRKPKDQYILAFNVADKVSMFAVTPDLLTEVRRPVYSDAESALRRLDRVAKEAERFGYLAAAKLAHEIDPKLESTFGADPSVAKTGKEIIDALRESLKTEQEKVAALVLEAAKR